MQATSVNLLERLRQPTAAREGWSRFVDLYAPLLLQWAKGLGMPVIEAADLVREVFAYLAKAMPDYQYDPRKSFRGWLKKVLVEKWLDWQRSHPSFLPASRHRRPTSYAEKLLHEDQAAHHFVLQRALGLLEKEFAPPTWKAFKEYVLAGRPAEHIARDLGVRSSAVFAAKARVLTRLRHEFREMLD